MVSFYSDFLTCGKPAAISDVIGVYDMVVPFIHASILYLFSLILSFKTNQVGRYEVLEE